MTAGLESVACFRSRTLEADRPRAGASRRGRRPYRRSQPPPTRWRHVLRGLGQRPNTLRGATVGSMKNDQIRSCGMVGSPPHMR